MTQNMLWLKVRHSFLFGLNLAIPVQIKDGEQRDPVLLGQRLQCSQAQAPPRQGSGVCHVTKSTQICKRYNNLTLTLKNWGSYS